MLTEKSLYAHKEQVGKTTHPMRRLENWIETIGIMGFCGWRLLFSHLHGIALSLVVPAIFYIVYCVAQNNGWESVEGALSEKWLQWELPLLGFGIPTGVFALASIASYLLWLQNTKTWIPDDCLGFEMIKFGDFGQRSMSQALSYILLFLRAAASITLLVMTILFMTSFPWNGGDSVISVYFLAMNLIVLVWAILAAIGIVTSAIGVWTRMDMKRQYDSMREYDLRRKKQHSNLFIKL